MPNLEQYQAMFHSLACGICQVALDEEFTLLYANPFFYYIYGYTCEEANDIGFHSISYILPEPVFAEVHAKVMTYIEHKERFFELEYQGVHRSQKPLWLLVRCTYDPARADSILCVLMDIAVHKKLEDELRMSMEESRMAFQLTDKMLYTFDIEERRLTLPKQVSEEFNLPHTVYGVPQSIVAANIIDENSVDEFIRFYTAMLHGVPEGVSEVKKRRRDGSFRWYRANYQLIYDTYGKPKRSIISCEDITEQREKELVYSKWKQYFQAQEGKTIGYYEYDLSMDQQIEGAGDTPPEYLENLKGYTETVLYIAEHFVYPADREMFYHFFDRNRLLTLFYDEQNETEIEYRRCSKHAVYWVRASVRMVEDPYTGHIKMFMMTLNIDREKQKTMRLQKLAETDEMTGLLKRETFIRKVNECLMTKDYVVRHAFILLDIDEFKQHNDTYGHQFGDLVIRDTARILTSSLRAYDFSGRLGGDEFMLFLNGISSQRDVQPRIAALCEKLNRMYPDRGTVSCSMGIAFYPQDGTDFQQLYQNADIALYEAKRSGRSTYRIYQKDNMGRK